jgi:hypothetical protein
MALVAGAFAAIRHAGAETSRQRSAHIAQIILDGLRARLVRGGQVAGDGIEDVELRLAAGSLPGLGGHRGVRELTARGAARG